MFQKKQKNRLVNASCIPEVLICLLASYLSVSKRSGQYFEVEKRRFFSEVLRCYNIEFLKF